MGSNYWRDSGEASGWKLWTCRQPRTLRNTGCALQLTSVCLPHPHTQIYIHTHTHTHTNTLLFQFQLAGETDSAFKHSPLLPGSFSAGDPGEGCKSLQSSRTGFPLQTSISGVNVWTRAESADALICLNVYSSFSQAVGFRSVCCTLPLSVEIKWVSAH